MAPRLLAITDGAARRTFGLDDAADLRVWLGLLRDADVDAVQVREKDLGDRELYDFVRRIRDEWPRWLLVNGRADVALAAGADGVHLPAAGIPVATLRRRFGAEILIGVSTHHPGEVAEAARDGASYATFGPVFATPSKMRYGAPPGLQGLRQAAKHDLPVVALGGIGPRQVLEVAAAGASGVAAIRAVHDAQQLERLAATVRRAWPSDENERQMKG